ncbi:hypothetical protein DIPPA_20001 [Diplonema papillatum]|nr:hypothetical protein DIPPA_20001 [Diplonema papillatum]
MNPAASVAGSSASCVHDPSSDLPVVLDASAAIREGKVRDAFERELFQGQGQGFNVVLYLGPIKRVNKKGKTFSRMLVVSRDSIMVAYAGNSFHQDAAITRAIPFETIQEAIILAGTTICLRVLPQPPWKTSYDLVFAPTDPGDVEVIVGIFRKCFALKQKEASPKAAKVPGLPLKREPALAWADLSPPLSLAKPAGWKVTFRHGDIPKTTWRQFYDSEMSKKHRAAGLHTSASQTNATLSPRSPSGYPAAGGRAHASEETMPQTSPPRSPWLVHSAPGTQRERHDDSSPAKQSGAGDASDDAAAVAALRGQIRELREQSELLREQQRLHLSNLNASRKLVSIIRTERSNSNGREESHEDHQGVDHQDSIHQVSNHQDPRVDLSPSFLYGSPTPGNGTLSPVSPRSPVYASQAAAVPLPLSPPPDHSPHRPFAHASGGFPYPPRPPPLPDHSPQHPVYRVGGGFPDAPSNAALHDLADQLSAVQSTVSQDLASKERQITGLRSALKQMIRVNESQPPSPGARRGQPPLLLGQRRGSPRGSRGRSTDEEEDVDDLFGDGFDSPRGTESDWWGSDGGGDSEMTDDVDSETEGLTDAHAVSIQTRRREVEGLLRQLGDLDASGRYVDSEGVLVDMRSQLDAVLADLEIEALSYQDHFLTGLPPTQRIDDASPAPPPGSPLTNATPRSFSSPPRLRARPSSPNATSSQGDPYAQWAGYWNYLATYYPAAYANYYAHAQAQALPSAQATQATSSEASGVRSNKRWKKWRKSLR